MNIDDLMKVLENSKTQLTHILNDCAEGSTELALLASKMRPMLEQFHTIEKELRTSVLPSDSPPETPTDTDTSSQG